MIESWVEEEVTEVVLGYCLTVLGCCLVVFLVLVDHCWLLLMRLGISLNIELFFVV